MLLIFLIIGRASLHREQPDLVFSWLFFGVEMGHVGKLIHDHGEAGNIKSSFSGLVKNVVIYQI